jgi:hypothetical protein
MATRNRASERKKNNSRLGSRLPKQEPVPAVNEVAAENEAPTVEAPASAINPPPAIDEQPEQEAPAIKRSEQGCTLVFFGDKRYFDRVQVFNTTAEHGIKVEFEDVEGSPFPTAFGVPANVARIILTNEDYMNFTGYEEHNKAQITIDKKTIVNNNLGIDATWVSADVYIEPEQTPQHYESEQRASNAPFNDGYYREDDEEPIMGQAGNANADGAFIGSLAIAQPSDNQNIDNVFNNVFTPDQEIREREGN